MKQRDKMRELFRQHSGNPEMTIKSYADAERRGEVIRKSNKRNEHAESYAAKLYADAVTKGWIHRGERGEAVTKYLSLNHFISASPPLPHPH